MSIHIDSTIIDGKPYYLRDMLVSDIDKVVDIENEIFPAPWSKRSFMYGLGTEQTHSWVLQHEQVIAGYLVFWFIVDELHIANIAIEKQLQRKGLATWMIKSLLSKAWRKGARYAHLEVRKSNTAAQTLYYKLGFKLVGERPKYYSSNNEDALLMTCYLDTIIDRLE